MILIAIGANLPSAEGTPVHTCEAALDALATCADEAIVVLRRSRWYESQPQPASAQPMYVNGVAELETGCEPATLLAVLHQIEARFGRERAGRQVKNAARTLDLDLLCYHQLVAPAPACPVLPHPRMHSRAFVLLPLLELAPGWRHPGSGIGIEALIAALAPGNTARVIA